MTSRWAVALEGHKSDLADWREALKAFDPAVDIVTMGDGKEYYLLHAKELEKCAEASEVREIAIPLMRHLNALMTVHCEARPVRLGTVVQQMEDGSLEHYAFAEMHVFKGRNRFHAVGIVGGGAPPPPRPSFVQSALTTASENMLEGLEHYSRADNWHDLYKAREALKTEFGEEHRFRAAAQKCGVSSEELKAFGRAAERIRHHRSKAKGPGMTLAEGKRLVAKLIRCILQRP